jgi:hypothetical protein
MRCSNAVKSTFGWQINPPPIFGKTRPQPPPVLPAVIPQLPTELPTAANADDEDLTQPNTPDLVVPASSPLQPNDDALSQNSADITLTDETANQPNLDT